MIVRMCNAAINATRDRIFIKNASKRNLSGSDLAYYNILKAQSGPSVHKPSRIIKSWIRAYNHEMEKSKWIAQMELPFRQKSTVRKIINSIFH